MPVIFPILGSWILERLTCGISQFQHSISSHIKSRTLITYVNFRHTSKDRLFVLRGNLEAKIHSHIPSETIHKHELCSDLGVQAAFNGMDAWDGNPALFLH